MKPTPKKTGSLVLQSILLVETEIGTTFPEGSLAAHSKAFNICSLLTQQLCSTIMGIHSCSSIIYHNEKQEAI